MPRIRVSSIASDIRDVLENRKRFVVICDRVENVESLLPDGCANLMPTDGPYHGIKKGYGWDNEHKSDADFLNWKRERYAAWKRILTPNGTLYDFASPQMEARVEVACRDHFNVFNHIAWFKPGPTNAAKYGPENFRQFVEKSERIVVAEQKGSDSIALGESRYGAKCDELRGFVFEPLRAYLNGERERVGFDRAACDRACGNRMSGHYFSRIQWTLPTRPNYEKLRAAFGEGFLTKPYEELRTQYEELRTQYEELRTQYEELRRPFSVTTEDQYTDVWTYPTVPYSKDKHPCEKPEAMAQDIMRISSRPNDVVLVLFSGSGVFASEALKQNRRVIAVEMDIHWAEVTERRCIEATA